MFKLDESHHPRVAVAVQAVELFVVNFIRQEPAVPRWLILAGDFGTGKTTLARAVVRYVRNRAVDILFSGAWPFHGRAPDAYFETWSAIASLEKESDFVLKLRDLADCDLIAFDDVGREADRFRSGVPQVRLAQTLDACRDKWLILTMNILEEQWPTAFDGRIVSRLESAGYMSLEGVPDYRQRKGRS